jgi:5'-deoxynucleotidase YfbR-like HD superfamily hydrolase
MRNSIEREYRAILNQMAYLYELRFNLNVEKEWKQYVELTTELEVLTSKLDELEDCLMLYK